MSRVFRKMAKVLKPGSPLAFTYHHNQLDAYFPVAVAMLDAGLVCSASLPCPAEMGASIHINGTASSIIDTVFVCRSTGSFPRRWLAETPAALAKVVAEDLALLQQGQVKPTQGDTRCIIFGHMIRLAVWNLRNGWKADKSTAARMAAVQKLDHRIWRRRSRNQSTRGNLHESPGPSALAAFGSWPHPTKRELMKYPFEAELQEILANPDRFRRGRLFQP